MPTNCYRMNWFSCFDCPTPFIMIRTPYNNSFARDRLDVVEEHVFSRTSGQKKRMNERFLYIWVLKDPRPILEISRLFIALPPFFSLSLSRPPRVHHPYTPQLLQGFRRAILFHSRVLLVYYISPTPPLSTPVVRVPDGIIAYIRTSPRNDAFRGIYFLFFALQFQGLRSNSFLSSLFDSAFFLYFLFEATTTVDAGTNNVVCYSAGFLLSFWIRSLLAEIGEEVSSSG